MAAFAFAGFGFYFLSPDVVDTEFCCDGNHNLEGKRYRSNYLQVIFF